MILDTGDSEIMRELVAEATADGIKRAVADPSLWAAASEGMRKHASAEAGGWLLSGMKAAFSRVMWVAIIGLAVYMVGGWAAVVALFKASGGDH
jgi:hypothetical protein